MPFIDMKGQDWAEGPDGGIYLMKKETSEAQVRRGGGGMLGSTKIKSWDSAKFVPGDVKVSSEAIKRTGLDFLVQQRPIIKVEPILGVGEDGTPEVIGWEPLRSGGVIERGKRRQANKLPTGGWDIVPDRVQNVRVDTGECLGVVGPGWTGPQNHEAFSFIDNLVDSGDAKWLGGGQVDGGRRIWMACQFDREVLIGGDLDERSVPLGFISNGWDGTLSLSITAAPYRMACLNGQTIPLEGYVRTWKARHTSRLTAEYRLQEARRTLELSIGYFDHWADAMNDLLAKPMGGTLGAKHFFEKLLPLPPLNADGSTRKRATDNVEAKRKALLDTYTEEPTLQNLGDSAYRVFNAVTSYADWSVEKPVERQALASAEASPLKDMAYKMLAAL